MQGLRQLAEMISSRIPGSEGVKAHAVAKHRVGAIIRPLQQWDSTAAAHQTRRALRRSACSLSGSRLPVLCLLGRQ